MVTDVTQENDESPRFDKDGFLRNYLEWNEALAHEIAARDGITLTAAHWEILHTVRRFYVQYERSPETRPLMKYLAQELGSEKINSIYVMKLFTGSPAKIVAKIAGIPKPPNCI